MYSALEHLAWTISSAIFPPEGGGMYFMRPGHTLALYKVVSVIWNPRAVFPGELSPAGWGSVFRTDRAVGVEHAREHSVPEVHRQDDLRVEQGSVLAPSPLPPPTQ